MNLLKSLVVGAAIFASALSYAEDGYDRSMKMNEQFRAEQKRIHGTESADKKADELKVKNTSKDQNNTKSKKENKAD
jgi:ADP-ribosylglycohydrolase